jgi:hypothetical protein
VPDDVRPPGAVSVTRIEFRYCRHVFQAARKFRLLSSQLNTAGFDLDSQCITNYRQCRVTFLTLAPDEETLRRAACTTQHVSVVRWTIARRRRIWSGVFLLAGWSSMSGAADNAWTYRAPEGGDT